MKTQYKNIFIRIGTAATIVALSGAFNVLPLSAQFNPEVNYQGKLTNASNVAVSDGIYHMKFRLYTAASGGTNIWEDDRSFLTGNRITVTSGLFSVLLGSSTPLTSVNFNQTLYLEVLVGGTASTSMETLSPRKKLGAVPAAFEAGKLDGVDSTSFVRSDEADTIAATSASTLLTINQSGAGDILNLLDGGNEVFTVIDAGNVGIGTTTPYAKLSVVGEVVAANFTATSTTATSTFAGGFAVETSGLVYDYSTNKVGIGTASPAGLLEIRNGDVASIRLSDSDVTHGMTGIVPTDVFGEIGNSNTLNGGLMMRGFSASDSTYGVDIRGYANTNPSVAAVRIVGIKRNGTVTQALGATERLFDVQDVSNILFTVLGGGNVGIGTTTPGTLLSLGNTGANTINISATATSTFGSGLDIRTGCFAINGTCVGAGSGSGTVGSGTTGQFPYYAANGTTLTATSSLFLATSGNVGIGTTTPWAKLSVGTHDLSITTPSFVIASSSTGVATSTQFIVRNGLVGIGTTSPYSKLSVWGSGTGTNRLFELTNSASTTLATFQEDGTGYFLGNIGIGTTSPNVKLVVQDTTPEIKLLPSGDTSQYTRLFHSNYWLGPSTQLISRSGGVIRSLLARYGDDLSIMPEGGNVGIGTTSPWAKLSIAGSATAPTTPLFSVSSSTPTGTTTVFHITSQGNVGIGTTSPSVALHLSSAQDAGMRIEATGIYAPGFDLWWGGARKGTFGVANQADSFVTGAASGDFVFRPDGGGNFIFADSTWTKQLFKIMNSGNVGIGTTTPWAKLSIAGSSAAPTTPLFSVSSSTPTGTTTVFHITSQGNVGIGTTTPGSALHVERSGAGTVGGSIQLRNSATNAAGNYTEVFFSGSIIAQARIRAQLTSSLASDLLFFTSDGSESEKLRITSAGLIGIGTTTPLSKLAVSGGVSVGADYNVAAPTNGMIIQGSVGIGVTSPSSLAKLVIDSGGGTNASLKLEHTGSNFIVRPVSSSGASTIIENTGGGALVINPNGGNVGIGTTSPWAKLSIAGSSAAPTTPLFSVSSSTPTGTTTVFHITSQGNVGIGTTSPTSRLHIVGDGTTTIRLGSSLATGDVAGIKFIEGDTGGNGDGGVVLNYNGSNNELNIRDHATGNDLVTFERAGNVGIGTTSPYAKLSVVGEVVAANFTATSTTATSTFAGGLDVNSGALQYDYGANKTSIENLNLGPVNFEPNAGVVSWIDISVTASSSAGTDMSYSAQIDSNKLLTVYGESNGAGGIQNTGVNIGTSTTLYSTNIPWNSLIVGDGIICLDNGGDNCDDAARTRGTIYANNATVSGLDVAEEYPTKDTTLEAGEIVMLDQDNPVFVRKYDKNPAAVVSKSKKGKGENSATTTEETASPATSQRTPQAFGVVSTQPGLLLGGFNSEKYKNEVRVPLALAGRVPLKVTMEGGPIAVGDRIAPSAKRAGAGMKSSGFGGTVGIALEPFTADSPQDEAGRGTILVFIDLASQGLSGAIAGDDMEFSFGEKGIFDLGGKDIANARSIISESGTWSISAEGTLITKRVETDTLRVGSAENPRGVELYDFQTAALVCMFVQGGEVKSVPGGCTFESGITGAATTPSTAEVPIPEPTQEPTPEPIAEPTPPPVEEPPAEETVTAIATTTPEQL